MSNTVVWKNVPISFFSRENSYGGQSNMQRTVFATVENLEDVPKELFGIKISLSKKPELAGKPMFKNFVYKMEDTDAWSSLAPKDATPASDLEEMKQKVIELFKDKPDARLAMSLKMHGKWGNIETSDGSYALYDDDHYVETNGDPNYYIKPDTRVDIHITPAVSHNNDYLQVNLSTDQSPDDIFQMRGHAAMQYWGEDNDDVQTEPDRPVHEQTEKSEDPWA